MLIKDRLALENMRRIDTVLFDKTGTLTAGEPVVSHIAVSAGAKERDVLAWAAAAEGDSEHPLAKAIVRAAQQSSISTRRVTDFRASAGVGVSATVNGRVISVGGPSLLASKNATAMTQADAWIQDGATILHVLSDGEIVGAISLGHRTPPKELSEDDSKPLVGGRLQPDQRSPRSRGARTDRFILPMEIGALLMSASTVVVALYVIPAGLVLAGLRRQQPLALTVLAITFVAVGLTMYDGGPLTVHLVAITAAAVALAVTTAVLVLRPNRTGNDAEPT